MNFLTQRRGPSHRHGVRSALARIVLAVLLSVPLVVAGFAPEAAAQSCRADDFAKAVDLAGAQLRAFNAENAPKVAAALKDLQRKRGWSDQTLEAKAIEYLHTDRIAELDMQANELLTKIDSLGEVDEKSLDCAKLPELQQAGRDLLATMREKTRLTLASIEAALARTSTADSGSSAARTTPPKAEPRAPGGGKPAGARNDSGETESARQAVPPPPQQPAGGSWDAATQRAPTLRPNEAGDGPVALAAPPSAAGGAGEPGYSIDEIKAATRGFFGTISTNLASVIEYAFSNYGRPSAYVLGSEGGGAFLAGARYGKGKLFMRAGEQRKVYWHGPSLGYDFGAEGSRTLFLIYSLKASDDLFRRYVGVDGSAYVLGGVGLTVLKGGPVVMAPIRTGVGLRLGANIGYIRFTPHATWNPF